MWQPPLRMTCSNGKFVLSGGDDTRKWHKRWCVRRSSSSCHLYLLTHNSFIDYATSVICRHFTIRGAEDTEFAGGIYHGRILLPPEYPFKPPNIVFLTPSGRFEVGTKVCLSFSAHHPELWQPAWGIRLILEALISFLPTPADGAIGALDWTKEERKRLAKESVRFCCAKCGPCLALLPKIKEGSASSAKKPSRFQKEIEQLHALQVSHHEKKDDESEIENLNVKANEGEAAAAAEDTDTEVPEIMSEEEGQKAPATPVAHEAPAISTAGNVAIPSDGLAASTSTNATDTAHAAGEASRDQVATQSLQEAGDDIGQNEPTASATEPAQAPAPAPARQAERIVVPSEEPPLAPWFSDPVVHAIIILFAVLVALMYRKFTALIDELHSLTNEYTSS